MLLDALGSTGTHQRHHANGHIDKENPLPPHVGHYDTAKEWAHQGSESRHGTPHSHGSAAFVTREDAVDHAHCLGCDQRCTKTLKGAGDDQQLNRGG